MSRRLRCIDADASANRVVNYAVDRVLSLQLTRRVVRDRGRILGWTTFLVPGGTTLRVSFQIALALQQADRAALAPSLPNSSTLAQPSLAVTFPKHSDAITDTLFTLHDGRDPAHTTVVVCLGSEGAVDESVAVSAYIHKNRADPL